MTERVGPSSSGDTHNDLSGTADIVVQSGRVLGGVHFHTASPKAASPPRQMPPAPTHFTGRAAELALLGALAEQSASAARRTVVISALAGAAGVGKTALALHWAHAVSDRFPDGDLYINLQGYDAGPPLSAHQALEQALVSLGVAPAEIPHGLDARVSLYRTLVNDRHMIIVLDNARDAAHVRPLLPGTSPSLVLVTSRSRLSGLVAREGIPRIVLDSLPPEEALELLGSVIGKQRVEREPAAAAELAAHCAHLPLALRIAAEQAAARPGLSLQALVAELGHGGTRLDALATYDGDETTAVREVFSWSYRHLPSPAARTFRLLGLFAGPDIGVTAAAALTGSTPSQAIRDLARLAGLHLLEAVGSDRYRFHDLLRDYAYERSTAEDAENDRHAALRRLFTWYLFTTESAGNVLGVRQGPAPFDAASDDRPDPALRLSFPSRETAADWCETEFPNLLATCRQAADIGEDVIAWQLPVALRSFFQLRRPTTDWVSAAEGALAAARRLGDRRAEAMVLRNLAAAHFYRGQYQENLRYNQEALEACRAIGEDEGWVLNSLGDSLVLAGRFEEAVECLRQALDAAERSQDDALAAHSLENIAPAYRALGRHEEAIAALREALDLFRDMGRTFGEGLVLDKLADLHLALGLFDEAMDFGAQALALHEEVGNRLGEATALGVLAQACTSTGRHRDAQAHLRRALAILEDLGHPDAAGVRERLPAPD
ncbi:tetratricopeptide repeat protein [Streptomyces sp. NPDC057116]|uniref:tetratricopeptide repeat protein n=1 Tax=Streptomyces sp. NPDC057116 TaxID=3346023 RepID=UPI0036297A23